MLSSCIENKWRQNKLSKAYILFPPLLRGEEQHSQLLGQIASELHYVKGTSNSDHIYLSDESTVFSAALVKADLSHRLCIIKDDMVAASLDC